MLELCRLTVEERDGVAVATFAGEIDISNADQLGAELRTRVSNRVFAVIVDLSEITYIDSQGLTMLFELNRRLRTRQQLLHLVVRQEAHLRRVLDLVEFGEVGGVQASIADARSSLASLRTNSPPT